MPDLTNIPSQRVPWTNPRTGLISREWYLFLLNLFDLAGAGRNNVSLSDLLVAPPAQTTDPLVTANDLQTALLQVQSGLVDQIAAVQGEVQALTLVPPHTPNLAADRYGYFYDTTQQTAAAINTAYAITFNTTAGSNGVTIGSPTSRITFDTDGIYGIDFSVQVKNTSGGAEAIDVWLSKGGVDYTYSTRRIRVAGNNTEALVSWDYLISVAAGEYIELKWSTTNTSLLLFTEVATSPHPGVASVTLTVVETIQH